MKRVLWLWIIISLVLVLSGCCDKTKNENAKTSDSTTNTTSSALDFERDAYFNTFENFEYSFNKTIIKDDNYVIRQSDEHTGDFYEIYDNDGNLLDKGYHGYRGSFDISKKDGIVILEYGFSGTNVYPKYRLYDVEKGKVSRYFDGPIATYDNLIAYLISNEQKTVLAVQDFFDIDIFYKEFTGDFNHSIYMDFDDLSFSDDGTKIIIKHSDLNNKNDAKEEIFEIN